MLRSIQKLIGDKRKQLIFPIFLMSLDAIGSLVMYLMLYFTVIHLLNGSLTGGLVRNYTIVCLISVILRLIIYRSGYFLCFSRGAEMCSGLRLDLANHYRSLSLGYFNQNSSGYLLSTLTKDLSNFELVLTHTLPSIVKTLVMGCLILVGTFFINWKLALAECVVILIALPVLNWGNRLVETYGTIKAEVEGIFLWAFEGLQRLVANNFKFTESERTKTNRESVKRDNNNIFDFMESEGYIRLKADASISSKELYEIYRMWCEENSLPPLKSRSFSDSVVANLSRYNLEHTNKITNSAGRRVWGFMGIEAVARPNINGFYDVSPCTYVPEEWRD